MGILKWYLIIALLAVQQASAQQVAKYVDPFIGTANNANTYPGALVPWGMIYINPYTIDSSSSANISYQKNASFISGFSHTSLSGVGCKEMGSILVMPSMGKETQNVDSLKSSYTNEKAVAGYYSVQLTKHQIKAEMTAAIRSGISCYTFKKAGKAIVTVDISRSLSSVRGAQIVKVNNNELEGFKTDGDFCGAGNRQNVYFVIKLLKEKSSLALWKNKNVEDRDQKITGEKIGAWFSFDVAANERVLVKVGISYVSVANARANLSAELKGWNFNKVKQSAFNYWDKELSKIMVRDTSNYKKTVFYTALYHTLIHPNVLNDVNGEYPAMRSKQTMKVQKGHNRYTVFSLWDTYRNLHSLMCLAYPERQLDMVNSMIAMYKESGWLPKWELAGSETHIMVGDPAVAVIAETYIKGIRNFDVKTAYEALLKNASTSASFNEMRPGLNDFLNYKYIPNDRENVGKDKVWGAVSTTLEYCYADWSIAQMAKALGKKEDAALFEQRSFYYRNLYDKTTGFLRPRLKSGAWVSPFNPDSVNGELSWAFSGGPGFVEGNAWQYSFMVPHDIAGLTNLMGGTEKFLSKLQQSFDNGQFVLWNEPDMAYPYLFNYFNGRAWQTQKLVRQQIKKHFNNTVAGIPGNDDCGTLSAWLVFSMIGIYPDNPVSGNYALTTPSFNEVVIRLSGNKTFTFKKQGGENHVYIKKMLLNNKAHPSYFLSHGDVTKGGVFEFYTHKSTK